MKVEGQVRIPSGCAIAAVISKEGKRMHTAVERHTVCTKNGRQLH